MQRLYTTLQFCLLFVFSGCNFTIQTPPVAQQVLPPEEVICFNDMDAGKLAYECQTDLGQVFISWEADQQTTLLVVEVRDVQNMKRLQDWFTQFCEAEPLTWDLTDGSEGLITSSWIDNDTCINMIAEQKKAQQH